MSSLSPADKKLTAAYEKMQEVASYINERKRESDNINKILEIESKLKGLTEVSHLLNLCNP